MANLERTWWKAVEETRVTGFMATAVWLRFLLCTTAGLGGVSELVPDSRFLFSGKSGIVSMMIN